MIKNTRYIREAKKIEKEFLKDASLEEIVIYLQNKGKSTNVSDLDEIDKMLDFSFLNDNSPSVITRPLSEFKWKVQKFKNKFLRS